MNRFLRLIALCCIAGVAACSSHHTGAFVPQTPAVPTQAQPTHPQAHDDAVSPTRNIFAEARGKNLSDAQLDAYITAPLSPQDRKVAHEIMAFMPPNQRGDFVYLAQDGHMMSNNPELAAHTAVWRQQAAAAARTAVHAQAAPHAASTRRANWYYSQCSPPNPPPPSSASNNYTGGPYTRDVAGCGFDGGWAFLNIPCGHTYFVPGDDGELYFEILGASGSLVEGGLEYYNDNSIAPHFRSSAVSTNSGMVNMQNNTVRYHCNSTGNYLLAIFHGITSTGNMTYTQVGEVPTSVDPMTEWVQHQIFSLNNASWMFYQAPSDDSQNAGPDGAGYWSPCRACSISKMTTIAQNNVPSGWGYTPDGSYFGTDGSYNYINWLEVGFGNWQSNCQPGTSLCTFDVSVDPQTYYGGTESYPDDTTAQSCAQSGCQYSVGYTGWGPYESYAGIALPGGGIPAVARRAFGAFTEPLPPAPCTADAYGLCTIATTNYGRGVCYRQVWDATIQDYIDKPAPYVTDFVYATYQGSQLRGVATKVISKSDDCSTTTTTWSPAEPRVAYGDSYLP